MSAPLRFLFLVVIGWGAVRLATAGSLPGGALLSPTDDAQAAVPPVAATEFPPIPPLSAPPAEAFAQAYPGYPPYPPYAGYDAYPPYPTYAPAAVMPPPRIYYYPVPVQPAALPFAPRAAPLSEPAAGPVLDFASADSAEGLAFDLLAGSALPPRVSTPAQAVPAQPAGPPKLDRLQLSSWALLRGRTGTATLASGGTLGGSQAGARLTYAFTRDLAASLRSTSPVGGRGVELALGARYRPLRSVPLWFTAERRQALGQDGGRSAFALFAEGGLYQTPLPWKFSLDAYAQAGVVGARSRDLFADGGFTATRPVYKSYSAGFGVWGGAQPGLYRVDAGPRISMKVRDNVRMHVDWRQRLAGNADPGSGPALTLAADF